MRYPINTFATMGEHATKRKISISKLIEMGLVTGLIIVAVTVVLVMVATTMGLAHLEPFNNCSQCIVNN